MSGHCTEWRLGKNRFHRCILIIASPILQKLFLPLSQQAQTRFVQNHGIKIRIANMVHPALMAFLIHCLRWSGFKFPIFEHSHAYSSIIKIGVIDSNILKYGSRIIGIRQIGNLSTLHHPDPFWMHFISTITSPASTFGHGPSSQSPNISMIYIMVIRNYDGWSIPHCIPETPSEYPVFL